MLIDFLIEVNILTIAVYLFLMFEIPSIGAPIHLSIGFLLFYDFIEMRYNLTTMMSSDHNTG